MQPTNPPLDIQYIFLEISGKKLNVQRIKPLGAPQGPPLVFLHEGLGCIEMWKDFPEQLVRRTGLEAIVYDRQGYGKSSPLDLPRPKNYLEKEALDYLPLLIEKLELTPAPILIGHSDGGTIALIYAGKYPVHALITEAAHILVEEITLKGILAMKEHPELSKIIQKLYKYHGEKTTTVFNAWADTWLSTDFANWNISDWLLNIQCPSLIIQGLDDEYASPWHVERILELIPSSTKKEAFMPPNCGHSPHLQAKELILDKMSTFILAQL